MRLEQVLGAAAGRTGTPTPIRELRPAAPADGAAAVGAGWRPASRCARSPIVLDRRHRTSGCSTIRGGAHLLLAVAGFNFARFQLDRRRPARAGAPSAPQRRPASPCRACAFIAAVDAAAPTHYALANVLLLNEAVGAAYAARQWHFWFIEDLVYLAAGAAGRCWRCRRSTGWERRWPFALPWPCSRPGCRALRRDRAGPTRDSLTTPGVLVLALRAGLGDRRRRRHDLAAAAGHGRGRRRPCPGYFGDPLRERVWSPALLLLIWVPAVADTAPRQPVRGGRWRALALHLPDPLAGLPAPVGTRHPRAAGRLGGVATACRHRRVLAQAVRLRRSRGRAPGRVGQACT